MLLLLFSVFIGSILLAGSFMYIIIMGPSRYHRDGVIGRLHRLITTIPTNVCGFCVSCFFGCDQRKGRLCCRSCATHTFKERNWLMVVFYVALVWTVEVLYLLVALPRLKASLLSKSLSWGLVLLSEALWMAAIFSDPGTVTAEADVEARRQRYCSERPEDKKNKRRARQRAKRSRNGDATGATGDTNARNTFLFSPAEEYVMNHRYVVDGMVYPLASEETLMQRTAEEKNFRSPTVRQPVGLGQDCTTCHVARPSRSKHCRLCKRCVRRYDHHCPWINNDVAERTTRYFLGFLLSHTLSCAWACVDLCRSTRQFLISHHAWGWALRNRLGRSIPLALTDYVAILVNFHMLETCLLFFAFCIGLVLFSFWAYQMSFAVANLTMNDLNKMDDTVDFVTALPTLHLVYREAEKVRMRLQEVAERKPRALLALQEPPPPKTEPGYEEGERNNRAYRKRVRKMLKQDLQGLYDRGVWHNLMEILFPGAPASDRELVAKAAAFVQ